MSVNIASARKQEVFAILEDTAGTLKFPSATNLILPAGNAVMNQQPAFIDSEEIRNSLDVLEQFEDSMPAGTWEVPTYVRPGGTLGSAPQAGPLFKSLLGGQSTGASATFATWFPNTSILFKQRLTAPSFSLFIKTDFFVQAMSGCTTDQGVLSLSNSGAVSMRFSGKGMQMYWAGQATVANAATVSASSTTFQVSDADRYSNGIWIYNSTKNDTNNAAGYKISGTNATTNVITVASALATAWSRGDNIKGYLPTGTEVGYPIEGEDTTITFDGVPATFRNTDLTIYCPKNYITDEVGTQYPAAYVEDTRQITSTLNLYFRKEDAKYFSEGYKGNEVTVKISMGQTRGKKVAIHMQKVRLQVPSITMESPVVALSIPMTALGTNGEDSLEWFFC